MRSIAAISILILTAAGCSSEGPAKTASEQPSQRTSLGSAIIIDVRSAGEFDAGHIDGAINIPHTEIGQHIAEVTQDKDQPIVVYCRSGRRSGIALNTLKNLGYTQVENAGGYEAFKRRLGQ